MRNLQQEVVGIQKLKKNIFNKFQKNRKILSITGKLKETTCFFDFVECVIVNFVFYCCTYYRLGTIPMYSWQVESNINVPGSSGRVARQFLKVILQQLAPNGVFIQMFRTPIQGTKYYIIFLVKPPLFQAYSPMCSFSS